MVITTKADWLHSADMGDFTRATLSILSRTGGRADGRTGGRADGRTGGRADGRTGGRADGRRLINHCNLKCISDDLDGSREASIFGGGVREKTQALLD
jgi:hypothetical protein